MKLEHWQPDLGTMVRRIDDDEIDLQPDFQRGQVWNRGKQQRLIDTILRGWSVPPVHLLLVDGGRMVVLDGQQRLTAIRDFVHGQLAVGAFEPPDPAVENLRGRRWDQLPEQTRRNFLNHTLACYRLWDYTADEPYELFFRLNLPTGLTQAEKRNALFGKPREQVRALVEAANWSLHSVGFLNSRMAYDDIIARCCCYVELGTLKAPLPVTALEARYRSSEGFAPSVLQVVSESVARVDEAAQRHAAQPHFNKATLLSWVMVFARQLLDDRYARADVAGVVAPLENARAITRRQSVGRNHGLERVGGLVELFTDRASLRVNDVLSVLARDFAIWAIAADQFPNSGLGAANRALADVMRASVDSYEVVEALRTGAVDWGDLG